MTDVVTSASLAAKNSGTAIPVDELPFNRFLENMQRGFSICA
jgi:hypothetical protein